jgi:hypothetical protein
MLRSSVSFVLLVLSLWQTFALECSDETSAAGGQPTLQARAAATVKPLPGQIVVDPQHPRWLMRHEGGHVFICGPGDPEDFLYVGKRNADGTRDGDQVARIEKLVEHGGNCIYIQLVRTHGGDARPDATQNPFVDSDSAKGLDEDILRQWDDWFARLDRHHILIYLFFYDDSARIWNTGDHVGPAERALFETIVKRYKHLQNLIWVIGEESEERYSTARVQALAQIIRAADDHGHLIGDHHQSGTTFKAWQERGALNHFAMQLSATDDEAHAGAIEALRKADGRYQIIYSESTAMRTDVDGMRSHAWAVAMGGVMPMLLRMDIASAPPEALQQCRHLQTFFEATDFWTLSPHDELKHGQTKYVLANPGRGYIAYGDQVETALGLKRLPASRYAVHWLDCRSGKTADATQTISAAGNATFGKPAGFGPECAAWIRPAQVLANPERGAAENWAVSASPHVTIVGQGGTDGVVSTGPDGQIHVVFGGKYRFGPAPTRLSPEEPITAAEPVNTVRMTIDAAGQPHVVFTAGVTDNARLSFYTARKSGRWLPLEKFADAADHPERTRAYVPDVAVDGQGHVLASYWVSRPTEKRQQYDNPSFYYRWRSPDGRWGDPWSLPAHWSSAPKVEFQPGRGFFLLWQFRGNQWRIAGPVAAGERFTAENSIATGSESLAGVSTIQNEGADFVRAARGKFVVAGNVREKFEGPVGVWAAIGDRGASPSAAYLGSFAGTKRGDESGVHPVAAIDAATGAAFVVVMNRADQRAYYAEHRGDAWGPYKPILPDQTSPQGTLRQGPSVADVPRPGVVALVRDGQQRWHLCQLGPAAATP